MTDAVTDSTIAELVKAFASAQPEQLQAEFDKLAGAVWSEGVLTELALPAAPVLVDVLDQVTEEHQGRLVILLGLLAEAEYPEQGPVNQAVRAGLDHYLALVTRESNSPAFTLALLYLLSHFPGDRERILGAVEGIGLGPEEQTRLERALASLDLAKPDLGRVWPAPSIWALNASEQDFDQSWINDLSVEQITTNWENDTKTVFGFSGAKAYWAVLNGTPVQVAQSKPARSESDEGVDQSTSGLFGAHVDAFRCANCSGALEIRNETVRCPECATAYPVANGVLDLTAGIAETISTGNDDETADLLQKLAEMPTMGLYYESVLRPAYLQIAGSNWGGAITPSDEDAYIATHIEPVDGPVLDLAAGAGRWTTVVSDTVGPDRLLALDMGLPMLSVLRSRLPEVPAVQGSALDLPFADASFGAVNMWNALQAFPDDAETAILEVGRVLRPGGTFTCMTFLFGQDPIYRHFQKSHFFPSRPAGHLLFELEDIKAWLDRAGMRIVELSGPETFVFFTAERI
ncbi:class I SAM-dependent methyltransferase [Amycolatopsis sp. 195334CR]|uniref:class I SAM-dependent methyltransferase n=1 Tax=Amycolatopsis sp. 195334CR TaxID=2814588 RepID=UPI001A8FCBFD|nr:class I SAM-dependent methyltransferase [Amycolatopsis sp. 195334CR]MBN6036969.1 class I SAM-dependent methyltransferase [Amycolatopsis sp. 195334CR]